MTSSIRAGGRDVVDLLTVGEVEPQLVEAMLKKCWQFVGEAKDAKSLNTAAKTLLQAAKLNLEVEKLRNARLPKPSKVSVAINESPVQRRMREILERIEGGPVVMGQVIE